MKMKKWIFLLLVSCACALETSNILDFLSPQNILEELKDSNPYTECELSLWPFFIVEDPDKEVYLRSNFRIISVANFGQNLNRKFFILFSVIDASGKLILSGNFYGGNLVDLGYYDECLDITSDSKTLTIEIPGKPENTTLHIPAFKGQYILTKILLDPTATKGADFHENYGHKNLADTIQEVIFCKRKKASI